MKQEALTWIIILFLIALVASLAGPAPTLSPQRSPGQTFTGFDPGNLTNESGASTDLQIGSPTIGASPQTDVRGDLGRKLEGRGADGFNTSSQPQRRADTEPIKVNFKVPVNSEVPGFWAATPEKSKDILGALKKLARGEKVQNFKDYDGSGQGPQLGVSSSLHLDLVVTAPLWETELSGGKQLKTERVYDPSVTQIFPFKELHGLIPLQINGLRVITIDPLGNKRRGFASFSFHLMTPEVVQLILDILKEADDDWWEIPGPHPGIQKLLVKVDPKNVFFTAIGRTKSNVKVLAAAHGDVPGDSCPDQPKTAAPLLGTSSAPKKGVDEPKGICHLDPPAVHVIAGVRNKHPDEEGCDSYRNEAGHVSWVCKHAVPGGETVKTVPAAHVTADYPHHFLSFGAQVVPSTVDGSYHLVALADDPPSHIISFNRNRFIDYLIAGANSRIGRFYNFGTDWINSMHLIALETKKEDPVGSRNECAITNTVSPGTQGNQVNPHYPARLVMRSIGDLVAQANGAAGVTYGGSSNSDDNETCGGAAVSSSGGGGGGGGVGGGKPDGGGNTGTGGDTGAGGRGGFQDKIRGLSR